MCGIVGYVGPQDATPIILNGLKRLEYRGYDSAGLAVLENGAIQVRREVGKLSRLAALLQESPVHGHIGIGHTRWATHGVPSSRNAHPHVGNTGQVVVVHNGIVENYLELRKELTAEGAVFRSETDTETIVHLIERYIGRGFVLVEAVREALLQIKGAHGIVVLSALEPDKIVAARIGNAGGVVVGIGDGEMFVASDMPAILDHTRKVVFLESRQLAVVTRQGLELQTLEGQPVRYQTHTIAWDPVAAEKGEYRHFMAKEIHEQVRSLTDTISGRVDFENGRIRLPELNLTPELARRIKKIVITACGTAAHAGLVGRILIQRIARIPVEVEIASEFRYSDPIVDKDTVVLAISQSGETVDTLAAMEEARRKGAVLWSIVNAIGSQAMRVADGYIAMQTGPEIGVASTKAFTAPLVDLYMLAILLADLRGTLDDATRGSLIDNLRLVPDLVGQCLDREADVEAVARALKDTTHCLYLGRGINMPIAYEGALKLKEISYIPTDAYAAGEMKHGPIALLEEGSPVLVVATDSFVYDKLISNVQEVKARGARIIAVASEGNPSIEGMADDVLWVPKTDEMLSPLISIVPLQLFAYYVAKANGEKVDQPRNLAKTVTVE